MLRLFDQCGIDNGTDCGPEDYHVKVNLALHRAIIVDNDLLEYDQGARFERHAYAFILYDLKETEALFDTIPSR